MEQPEPAVGYAGEQHCPVALNLQPAVTANGHAYHLGVDNFTFRQGQHNGTILVDLDTNRSIALLQDRESETLAQWLQQHPGVQVLSRDRSKVYK